MGEDLGLRAMVGRPLRMVAEVFGVNPDTSSALGFRARPEYRFARLSEELTGAQRRASSALTPAGEDADDGFVPA